MSRVRLGQKYMNVFHCSSTTNASSITRIHNEKEDFRKAKTLTSWLFMKYDMSYKVYKRKSKNRRIELKKEYEDDTGNKVN